jgi:hypothetical protein
LGEESGAKDGKCGDCGRGAGDEGQDWLLN